MLPAETFKTKEHLLILSLKKAGMVDRSNSENI
jgi:hypothetical protein